MVPPAAAYVFLDWLAGSLLAQAATLAERWRERAAAAAPRPIAPAAADGDAELEAESTVRALVASLQKDARWHGEVMRRGWEAGAGAHRAGLAPHHVLTDAELLVAIVLAAAEQCAAGVTPVVDGAAPTAADGIAAARRLQRAGALYAHAAAASFLHATVATLRAHYRVLRHDLRNPIGTIRGAVSLMEDESVPAESRFGPNVRAMVTRNALSLDRMIAAGLDDVAAESLLTGPRDVSLRDLALAARRSLREPARLAAADVVVGPDLPVARVDAAAVELTLSALLLAGLACAGAGAVLRVEAVAPVADGRGPDGAAAPPPPTDAVVLRLVHEGPADAVRWDREGLELATSVAAEFGGRICATLPEERGRAGARHRSRRAAPRPDLAALAAAPTLFVELPVLPAITPADAAAGTRRPGAREPRPAAAASPRHQRDDLARAD